MAEAAASNGVAIKYDNAAASHTAETRRQYRARGSYLKGPVGVEGGGVTNADQGVKRTYYRTYARTTGGEGGGEKGRRRR